MLKTLSETLSPVFEATTVPVLDVDLSEIVPLEAKAS